MSERETLPFLASLASDLSGSDPVRHETRVLENTAFYDFSFYELLFPTETGYQGLLSERALATLDDFQAQTDAALAALLLDVLAPVERAVWDRVRRLKRRDWDEERVLADLLEDFYDRRGEVLPPVLEAYRAETEDGIGGLFLEFLEELAAGYVGAGLHAAYPVFHGFWEEWPAHFGREYPLWNAAVQPPAPPETEAEPAAPAEEEPRQAPPAPRVDDPTAATRPRRGSTPAQHAK